MLNKIKEWLKPKNKNKVGRPKLANKDTKKIVKIEIALAFVLCATLVLSGTSVLTGKSPIELLSFGMAGKASGRAYVDATEGDVPQEYKLTCNGVDYGRYKVRYYTTPSTLSEKGQIGYYRTDGKPYTDFSQWVKAPTVRYEVTIPKNNEIRDIVIKLNNCAVIANYNIAKAARRVQIFVNFNDKELTGNVKPEFYTYYQYRTANRSVYSYSTINKGETLKIDNKAPELVETSISKVNDGQNNTGTLNITTNENIYGAGWGDPLNPTIKVSLYKYATSTKLFETTTSLSPSHLINGTFIGLTGHVTFYDKTTGKSILVNSQTYTAEIILTDAIGNVSEKKYFYFRVYENGTASQVFPTTSGVSPTAPVTTTIKKPFVSTLSSRIGNVRVKINAYNESPVRKLTTVKFRTTFDYIVKPSAGGQAYFKTFEVSFLEHLGVDATEVNPTNIYKCVKIRENDDYGVTQMTVREQRTFGRWGIFTDANCRDNVGYLYTQTYEYTE